MKKVLVLTILILIIIFIDFKLPISRADSDPCDVNNLCSDAGDFCINQLAQCSSKLNQALTDSKNATAPLESQLNSLQAQINGIEQSVANIESSIAQKKINIDRGYKDIAAKKTILYAKVKDYYIKSYYDNPIVTLLSVNDATDITRALAYQKSAEDEDKNIITNISLEITQLQKEKTDLESQEIKLTALKSTLDTQSASLAKIVDGAKAYQSSLSQQIAQLSSKQQQLIAQKLGSLNIPLFAYNTQGGCSSDINPYKDPGFAGVKFGFFTYGVPNRVGLNQYGAYGRANAGESSDQILHAYYNFDGYQNYSGITISVNDSNSYGAGNIIWSGSLEDYMQRIYEVPDSWPMESLKAQAIAARSYVLAETHNGAQSICATQSCQVFQTNPKGGNWANAVSATTGQAMVQGGNPITAYFSSTHGGYVYTTSDIGWASTSFTKEAQDSNGSINSWSDLQNNAYDKSSPWFYCDWGGRSQYNNTAWMASSDVADITNVILLAKADSSTQNHLSQPDKPNPDGVDTWDSGRVQQELKNRGITPFTNVSLVSVNADFGRGVTTSVTVNGDAGTQTFDASTFKSYFNLRAPSNIQIVGPLFNIEQR